MNGNRPHSANENAAAIQLADNPQGTTMRRGFLWTLIASVLLCATIAVFTLLFAKFTETTIRVLATLGAVSVYSGASVLCATTLDRGLWPRLSRVGLVLFAIALGLLLLSIWGVWDWETHGKLNGTATAMAILYLYAIPGANLVERRTAVRFGAVALIAAAVSFIFSMLSIWIFFPYFPRSDYVRLAMTSHVVAICLAHAALLYYIAVPIHMGWVRWGAFAAIAAFGGYLSAVILYSINGDFETRLLGALGVVDASATIGLLIFSRLRRVEESEARLIASAQVELSCPRCSTRQTVTTGATECSACGLRFKIEVEEPRCAGCQYPLWNLPERRCPECGRSF